MPSAQAHAQQKLSEHNVCTSNTIFSNFRCVFSLRNTRSTIPISEIKCVWMVVQRAAYTQLIKQPKSHKYELPTVIHPNDKNIQEKIREKNTEQ